MPDVELLAEPVWLYDIGRFDAARELLVRDLDSGDPLEESFIMGETREVFVHEASGVRQRYTNTSGRTLRFGAGLHTTEVQDGERIFQDGPHRPSEFPAEDWGRLEIPALAEEEEPDDDSPLPLS